MEKCKLAKVPYTLFEYPHYPDADYWCPLCGQAFDEARHRCSECGIRIVGETTECQRFNARLRAQYPELRGTTAKFE